MTAPDIRIETPETIHDWMVRGEAVVYDVREQHEWQEAHIDGALLLPLSQFDPAAISVPEGKRLVFHCRSGVRCGAAAQQMVLAGAPVGVDGTIYRLAGGIIGWAQSGLPVSQG